MKNSFFLVIPTQEDNSKLLASYEKEAVIEWIKDLPTANPALSTRLLYDFIETFNELKTPSQHRLDVIELLRPSFLLIEDNLRSRLMVSGFPKGEDQQKIFDLLVSLERNFTIGYWVVIRELTGRDSKWFQGKNIALAIQRTMKGLSEIIVTHYMMFLSAPDWVWIDLHSLYKLSLKTKKETSKVPDITCLPSKVNTPEDCYKQVLLLSLTDPSGLMQKEIGPVYKFIGSISHFIQLEKQAVTDQKVQYVILMDEDAKPFIEKPAKQVESSVMYLNLLKLFKALQATDKYSSKDGARFSSIHSLQNTSNKMPISLFEYIQQCWKGMEYKGVSFFSDRLDRYIAIGLDAAHTLQNTSNSVGDKSLESLAESFSDRELSCHFKKEGILSLGSLVSFRKTNELQNKRILGIVKKITVPRQGENIIFELSAITSFSYAVDYIDINAATDLESDKHKALLYGVKSEVGERTYIIIESFKHKNEDGMRLFLDGKNFPIVLGNRKNIGLGYWQFECRQIEEQQVEKVKKIKGYDFI